MNIPSKKLHNGFAMPAFGIGTWHMGGTITPDHSRDREEIDAIKRAIDLGITHIDTAELYGQGHAEELTAQAIKGRDRSKLFIVSKVYSDHLEYKDVLESCKHSLKRLETDYLDLYLVHVPNPEIPIAETMGALDVLKATGMIKQIGVSNFTVEEMEGAKKATKNDIVTNQIHYSLAYRKWQDIVDYCQAHDIMVTAYRPVERGALSRKGIPILDEMCRAYGKTPAQIAINWLISQNNIVLIVKMSSEEHLAENIGAIGWSMSKADIERLKNEFPAIDLPQGIIKFKK